MAWKIYLPEDRTKVLLPSFTRFLNTKVGWDVYQLLVQIAKRPVELDLQVSFYCDLEVLLAGLFLSLSSV